MPHAEATLCAGLVRRPGKIGDVARGRELLELSIEILEARGQTRFLVDAYKDLASLLKETGDSEAALTLLERALGVQAHSGRKLQ
jgi:hypothetical protein